MSHLNLPFINKPIIISEKSNHIGEDSLSKDLKLSSKIVNDSNEKNQINRQVSTKSGNSDSKLIQIEPTFSPYSNDKFQNIFTSN